MKKIFLFISAVFSAFIIFCFSVFSAEPVLLENGCYDENSNIVWSFYDDGSFTVEGSGEIAPFTDYTKVPYLDLFKDGKVTALIIDDGITGIGDYAFYGCSAETVVISPTVKKIGRYTFFGMDNAENIALSENVAFIGESAFSCSDKLTVSVNSDNGKYITDEYGILYDCGKTEIIFCPVNSILSDYAFPSTLTEIKADAFNGVLNLTEVCFPRSLKNIGENAFRNCKSLEKVIFNYGIEAVGTAAFENCINLGEVYYYGTEKSLSAVRMHGCGIDASDIVCGYCKHTDTVTTAGLSASCNAPGYSEGKYCIACGEYAVPREVITVSHTDTDTDGKCDVCGEEYCDVKDCGFCCSEEHDVIWVLFGNGKLGIYGSGEMSDYGRYEAPFYKYCDSITKVTVGGSVAYIGKNAFYDMHRLTAVTGGDGIKSIGESAFEGAYALRDIDGFAGLEFIGDKSFKNCRLTEWNFCSKVKAIGCESFLGCDFQKVNLSVTVESVGDRAFYSCSLLSEVYVGKNVHSIGEDAFGNCTALAEITVDGSNIKFYGADGVLFNGITNELVKFPPASEATVYQVSDGIEKIAYGAFGECKNLEVIAFNGELETIGDYAFSSCTSLSEIDISYGIESVGEGAFSHCTGLENLTIGVSVSAIGNFAFSCCTALEEAVLPPRLTVISEGAFYGCSGLKRITVGKSVNKIEKSAFALCENLEIVLCDTTREAFSSVIFDEFDNGCFSAALKHFFNHTTENCAEVPPVCVYVGYKEGIYCKECKYYISGHEEIEAQYDEHITGDYTVFKPSNCTVKGEERAYCIRGCGYYEIRELSLKEHEYTASEIIKPTCTEKGYTKYVCSCGLYYQDDFTDTVSHSLSDYYTVTAPTCTSQGKERAECRNCKYYTERKLPPTGHSYRFSHKVNPTCTSDGYSVYYCNCGYRYSGNKTKALGHSFSSYFTVDKKATCYEQGSESRHCTRCGIKTDIRKTNILSHSYTYVISGATLKANGSKNKVCKLCGKMFSSDKIYKIKSVSLSDTSYVYDGKTKKPYVTVKDVKGKTLVNGTDYTLKYSSGRKKIGEYTVTVNFIGKYSGLEVLTFRICPADVKTVTAKPSIRYVTLSWSKVKGATGYRVYYYDSKAKKYIALKDTKNLSYTVSKIDGAELKSGTDYKFAVRAYSETGGKKIFSAKRKYIVTATKPVKAFLKSVSSSSGRISVGWKEMNCDGYELVYAANKSFSSSKKVTVKGQAQTRYTLKNVARGKTYYVKIRGYKIIDGEKVYGYYSDVKAVKVR